MKSNLHWLSKSSALLICLILCGCGVKGKPQAPSVETPIGHGSPEADALQQKKKNPGQKP